MVLDWKVLPIRPRQFPRKTSTEVDWRRPLPGDPPELLNKAGLTRSFFDGHIRLQF